MRHSRLFFLAAALLTLPVLCPCPHARAQRAEVEPLSTSQPCDEIGRPGRPTLVRRVSSDAQTTGAVGQKTVEGKCKALEGSDRQLVSLRFVGLNSFREKEVLRFFLEDGFALELNSLPDLETANRAAAVLKKLLSSKGHVYAIVSVIRDEDLNSLTFQVIEGERLSLADIQFEGLRVSSPEALKTKTRQCFFKDRNSQTAYEKEVLEYCLRYAANALRSQGYLQARFGEPKSEITGPGIIVTVHVEEGPLYGLGEIKIEGSERFSAMQLRAMLPLSQGEVATGHTISKWLYEDLKKLYGDLGYLQYIVEPDPTYKKSGEGEGIVDFRVIIEEGKQFRLRSLKFEGHQLPAEDLLKYSSLRVGEIYSASAFQDFVNKLNESELFEPIDMDGDSDFRTSEEEGLLSITLKLRRRSQH